LAKAILGIKILPQKIYPQIDFFLFGDEFTMAKDFSGVPAESHKSPDSERPKQYRRLMNNRKGCNNERRVIEDITIVDCHSLSGACHLSKGEERSLRGPFDPFRRCGIGGEHLIIGPCWQAHIIGGHSHQEIALGRERRDVIKSCGRGGARKFMPEVIMNAYAIGELGEEDGSIPTAMPDLSTRSIEVHQPQE
jgi:hypothetical protein